ncbi:hypothetical protein EJ357_42580 [Streptomyces cyaneochromogenes]|uniref:Uncharacterized protein n=1 Tax=Streptomyces cyaneochromogenes TaxID=2496836 RepID=A0A3S9MJE4_9ACTN|nr:hypothetical protein EJ357_42580 [Streptomyces cyaneochromogenes]
MDTPSRRPARLARGPRGAREPGGRTWTDRRLGRDLENGGTWLHWTQPHVPFGQRFVRRSGRAPGRPPAP